MPAGARKRRAVGFLQRNFINPLARRTAGRLPGTALIETVGRKTGKARRTPVGVSLEGDVLWLVAEQGRHANYVRNMDAEPHVRVRVHGGWRTGVAHLLPDDDPRERLRSLPRVNGLMVRLMGTDLLTVRIDLDPQRL